MAQKKKEIMIFEICPAKSALRSLSGVDMIENLSGFNAVIFFNGDSVRCIEM